MATRQRALVCKICALSTAVVAPAAPSSAMAYIMHVSAQFMMRTRSGEPVFAFELWHERLLPAAAVAARNAGRS